MSASASLFLQKCQEFDVTVLSLPTAYWHELTASLGTEGLTVPPSLRLVIIGGERCCRSRWRGGTSMWARELSC